MRLEGKTLIVSGAAGGMGKETVLMLLKEGANVVATDVSANFSFQNNRHLQTVEADLTDEAQVKKVIDAAIESFGTIDGLVNIAGMAQAATPVEEVSAGIWEKIQAVNVTSAFYTCREVVPHLKKQKKGVIVNIASIAAERARPGLSAYIASKGAVVAFSKALASELAGDGIRVNVINPGPSDTDMLGEFAAEGTNVDDVKKEMFKQSVPLGELVKPVDIASAVIFLCSDESRMATGAVFNIDGGRGL